MDNIKKWTGLTMEESSVAEDRDKWRKYTFMVWPTFRSKMAEKNRIEQNV